MFDILKITVRRLCFNRLYFDDINQVMDRKKLFKSINSQRYLISLHSNLSYYKYLSLDIHDEARSAIQKACAMEVIIFI